MQGKIQSGQLVTVDPAPEGFEFSVGDIVLCKVNGHQYLHLISALDKNRAQISNNKGHVNGWCSFNAIYGKVVKVED
jgi:hypothetical protein